MQFTPLGNCLILAASITGHLIQVCNRCISEHLPQDVGRRQGTFGHISQNRDVFLLNVHAEGFISDCVLLESIQDMNRLSCFAELSTLHVDPRGQTCYLKSRDRFEFFMSDSKS